MAPNRLDVLLECWAEGTLSLDESRELNELLRASPEARRVFQEATVLHGMLHSAVNSLAIETAVRQTQIILPEVSSSASSHFGWRNMVGVVIGMTIGIIGMSAVWGLASPSVVAVSRPVATFSNASFESTSTQIGRGFPSEFGQWGGDEVEVVTLDRQQAKSGKNALRFVAALPDAGNPSSRAIACDLFQLVDLRSLRAQGAGTDDIVLELSASYSDNRPRNSQPSVSFFCQLYLFHGDRHRVTEHWPEAIRDAVSSASAEVTTLGDSGWRTITARTLVPTQADFAVVHFAARPNLRVSMPDGLFVDQIELVAKTQPLLPVRDGQRE